MGINKDQVEGRAKEAAGKVQEVAGKTVGSTTQQVKGAANKAAGAAQASMASQERFEQELERWALIGKSCADGRAMR